MNTSRDGFSLIEMIVAMLILTVGILAMGASTGYVLGQVRAAELRTDRMVAVRQVAEMVRSVDFDELADACTGPAFNAGRYSVSCEVHAPTGELHLRRVELISVGPGMAGRRVQQGMVDTTAISISRPVQ
jgi:prepilin-type N-terminal cleavage/methylation domain-containing protein